MSRKLSSMPSRCPPAVSPRPDDGVSSRPAPLFVGGTGSVEPAGPTVLKDGDVRRRLRGRRGNAEMSALARLCVEELDEQSAAVVDRDEFCLRVGRRLLRRLEI